MKQRLLRFGQPMKIPAAFRRLCVETIEKIQRQIDSGPAAFRRLCVETYTKPNRKRPMLPAAFRRLCVETLLLLRSFTITFSSRLQAAVC